MYICIYVCMYIYIYVCIYIVVWHSCQIWNPTSQTSDLAKKGGDRGDCDKQSMGALVRPLWHAVAQGLKPLRLPHAQLQVIFRKRATNFRALLPKMSYKDILWVFATLYQKYSAVSEKKIWRCGCFDGAESPQGEMGGWGRVPFSRNLMSPTPRRKWYLTTGRRFH